MCYLNTLNLKHLKISITFVEIYFFYYKNITRYFDTKVASCNQLFIKA